LYIGFHYTFSGSEKFSDKGRYPFHPGSLRFKQVFLYLIQKWLTKVEVSNRKQRLHQEQELMTGNGTNLQKCGANPGHCSLHFRHFLSGSSTGVTPATRTTPADMASTCNKTPDVKCSYRVRNPQPANVDKCYPVCMAHFLSDWFVD